tara:strand:- start:176 stop:349 length:174 start_codon:yes stop_codon:yes gene_type:complete
MILSIKKSIHKKRAELISNIMNSLQHLELKLRPFFNQPRLSPIRERSGGNPKKRWGK